MVWCNENHTSKSQFYSILKTIGLLFIVIIWLIGCSKLNEVNLTIVNQSNRFISNIDVRYGESHKLISGLKGNDVITVNIIPEQESSLEIKIYTPEEIVTTELDIYLEKGYKGSINIEINDELQAKLISQDIKI